MARLDHPSGRNLKFLQECMRRDDLGTVDLIVEDSEIWTHSKMSDLLAISVRELEGLFLEQNPVPIVLSRITNEAA
jgi:hypothetical protein